MRLISEHNSAVLIWLPLEKINFHTYNIMACLRDSEKVPGMKRIGMIDPDVVMKYISVCMNAINKMLCDYVGL